MSLEFTETELAVLVLPESAEAMGWTFPLTSQTVYELEHLSVGLRVVGAKRVPGYRIRSHDVLIGLYVHLQPAIRLGLDRLLLFVSTSPLPGSKGGRDVIDVEILLDGQARAQRFEVEDVLAFSEALYERAKALAARFVSDADEDLE